MKPGQIVNYPMASGDHGVGGDDLDLRAISRVLWRRKGLIVGTTLALTTLAVVGAFLITPMYGATAYIMVEPGQTKIVEAVEAVVAGSSADSATVESEARVLQSRGLADRVVTELALDKDPEFNRTLESPSLVDRWLDPVKEVVAAAVSRTKRWIAGTDDPARSETLAPTLQARIIDKFLSRLDVAVDGRSRVIGATFTSRSPETAAKVVNALTDHYILMRLESKFAATRTAGQWLNDRVEELRQRVEMSEAAVEKYRAQYGLIASGDVMITTQEAADVGSQLAAARSQRADAEARLREVESAIADPGGVATVSAVLGSALIQGLTQQEAEIQRKVSDFSQMLGSNHPDLLRAQAELAEIRSKIDAEVQKILRKMQNELVAALAREASLNESLEALKSRAGEQNQVEVKLRALEREATASRTLLETFLARAQETSSQESYQRADAHIVSRADTPNSPSSPKRNFLIIAGFFVASALSVLLAFLVESMDSGFRSEEQLEQMLGVVSLGLVPSLKRSWGKGQRPSTYVVEHPASAYVESIRGLYTSLRLSNGDHLPRVVLIASSLPNEGKTTLAVSFASLLSGAGLRALVIDTDMRKPSVHRALGLAAKPGLVDYLQDRSPLMSVIQHETSTGIDAIAAGGSGASRPDLLGTDRMRGLLDQLQTTYDVVILDSAPLLAVSETRILVRIADKTVFLVRWADTRRDTAARALQHVAEAGSNVVGVMLTMVDLEKYTKRRYGEFSHYYRRIEGYYAA